MRAVDQMQSGAHPEEVAAGLGLHRTTVYGWRAQFRAGGRDALLAKPIPGRPPKLGEDQQRQVFEWVTGSDPRQLAFDFALWTRQMVRELIRREFGVVMSSSAVGRMLHRLGLSPQRPVWRAWQADPDKVAAWKDSEYPKIVKQAKKQGATVYFLDEAGIRSDHHAGTTWGRVGQTPIVKTTGARHSLNMISAVTAKGLLRLSTFTGGFNAGKFIEFAKKLLHDADGPVFLIVDGHPAHRAKKVKAFVESTDGRLRFVLPARLLTPTQPR